MSSRPESAPAGQQIAAQHVRERLGRFAAREPLVLGARERECFVGEPLRRSSWSVQCSAAARKPFACASRPSRRRARGARLRAPRGPRARHRSPPSDPRCRARASRDRARWRRRARAPRRPPPSASPARRPCPRRASAPRRATAAARAADHRPPAERQRPLVEVDGLVVRVLGHCPVSRARRVLHCALGVVKSPRPRGSDARPRPAPPRSACR